MLVLGYRSRDSFLTRERVGLWGCGAWGVGREEYFAWGLHQIAKAVNFLNNDCKLVRPPRATWRQHPGGGVGGLTWGEVGGWGVSDSDILTF